MSGWETACGGSQPLFFSSVVVRHRVDYGKNMHRQPIRTGRMIEATMC